MNKPLQFYSLTGNSLIPHLTFGLFTFQIAGINHYQSKPALIADNNAANAAFLLSRFYLP